LPHSSVGSCVPTQERGNEEARRSVGTRKGQQSRPGGSKSLIAPQSYVRSAERSTTMRPQRLCSHLAPREMLRLAERDDYGGSCINDSVRRADTTSCER